MKIKNKFRLKTVVIVNGLVSVAGKISRWIIERNTGLIQWASNTLEEIMDDEGLMYNLED